MTRDFSIFFLSAAITVTILLPACPVLAQLPDLSAMETLDDQELEFFSEWKEGETEDEYSRQLLAAYLDHPLNLNDDWAALAEFPLLQALQIDNLLQYRRVFGALIDVYELQAVPGFDLETIRAILPYVRVSQPDFYSGTLRSKLRDGKHQWLLRPSLVPEQSRGFRNKEAGGTAFRGSRPRVYFRYTYRYRDLMQYGVLGDKDAGEQFGQGPAGFDFHSFHLLARKLGLVKVLAVGDYTINFGQGLIHWQSLAFNKGSRVIDIKRQGESVRAYHSAGEYNFHRGVAAVLQKGRWSATFFGSSRKISTNLSTHPDYGPIISSIRTDGLHRTSSEWEDRNNTMRRTFGGNFKLGGTNWHLAANTVYNGFSLPWVRRAEPYNFFAIRGANWSNYSLDYSYTFQNVHLFGELAADRNRHAALLAGGMISLHPAIDLAILYRGISSSYQSIYGNAFTENSLPSNEYGLYAGLSLKPGHKWQLDMYADNFRFPWLQYRVDAPSAGSVYMAQVTLRLSRQIELYTRFRRKEKPLNPSSALSRTPLRVPGPAVLKNWRTHISYQLTNEWRVRSRLEACWFFTPGKPVSASRRPESGFLMYADIIYKPRHRRYAGSLRFQVFETGGYDTRIYAYENDVLFSGGTPAFFGQGTRLYCNLKSRFRPKFLSHLLLDLGLRAAMTVYPATEKIGSGLDEIEGKHRSEIKLQLLLVPVH